MLNKTVDVQSRAKSIGEMVAILDIALTNYIVLTDKIKLKGNSLTLILRQVSFQSDYRHYSSGN